MTEKTPEQIAIDAQVLSCYEDTVAAVEVCAAQLQEIMQAANAPGAARLLADDVNRLTSLATYLQFVLETCRAGVSFHNPPIMHFPIPPGVHVISADDLEAFEAFKAAQQAANGE
jgi:hypothetical protein